MLLGSLLIVLVLFTLQAIGLALIYKLIILGISATTLGAMFLMTLALYSLRQHRYSFGASVDTNYSSPTAVFNR